MDSNYPPPTTPSQPVPQQENVISSQQTSSFKKFSKKKILIILLLILLLPVLYILIKLGLTGFIIYSNLSKIPPKPTPSNYANTPTLSDTKLDQLRKQARNELRTVDIDSISAALEKHYGSEESDIYPSVKNEWFATGKIPKDPLGYEYLGLPKEATASFEVCSSLEDANPDKYCVKSKN